MAVSPPFTISETLPLDSDLISNFPGQEHPFRDTVESWLTFLSDPTTGLLKASAFAFPLTITNSGAGSFLILESTEAGASAGPVLELYRNSASPAASDIIGQIIWYGESSTGAKVNYADIFSAISDPTNGSMDTTVTHRIMVAGATTNRLVLNAAGVTVSGAITYSGTITGLTGTGALNSGSITSGFGEIDIGADPITAGAATFASMASSGAVSGTTGTFSGAVAGTTGTFSGAVEGTTFAASSNIFGSVSANTLNFRPNGVGSATAQMTYTAAGNLTAAGDITASSDRRLKKSISPLNHLWANDMVREVQPMTFLRKRNDQRGIGFIAQDVQHYAPEIVHEDENTHMLSLAYPNMVAILWAVVQDLQQKVAELEAK